MKRTALKDNIAITINLSQGIAKTPRSNPKGVEIIDHELYQAAYPTKIT